MTTKTNQVEYLFCYPKGGHLCHVRQKGVWKALCGFAPSSPDAWRMRPRAGWYILVQGPGTRRRCRKCLEKHEALLTEAANAQKAAEL